MYDKVDLPELNRMAVLADAQPPQLFDMSEYIERKSCGTSGCLLGTWSMYSRRDRFRIFIARCEDGGETPSFMFDGISCDDLDFDEVEAASKRFGVPLRVCDFLFREHGPFRTTGAALNLSQTRAVARLRKYIAHVEDQRRRWANHEWLMQRSKAERRAVLLCPRRKQEAVVV